MIRFLPTSVYDLPAIEDWLSEQAERGRIFDGFYGPWAIFKKGEPQHLTYRLEPNDGNNVPGDEREAAYARAGWDFLLGAVGVKLWVFVANRPDPVPIHTDPVTEGVACERLHRKLRWKTLLLGLLTAAFAAWCVWRAVDITWTLPDFPFLAGYHLLPGQWMLGRMSQLFSFLNLAVVMLYGLVIILRDNWALRRLVKSLEAGVRPQGGRRTHFYRWCWIALLATLCAFSLILFALLGRHQDGVRHETWFYGVDSCPWNAPHVPVEVLGAAPVDDYWERVTQVEDSLERVTTVSEGDIASGWAEDRLLQGETTCYQLRLSFLHSWWVDWLRARTPELAQAERLTTAALDEVWYAQAGGAQYLLAREDGKILLMRAEDVPDDLRDHLDDFDAALETSAG